MTKHIFIGLHFILQTDTNSTLCLRPLEGVSGYSNSQFQAIEAADRTIHIRIPQSKE